MYRIKIRDDKTGLIWLEYGFSKLIMKHIHFYYNEVDDFGYHIYDILDISAIVFSLETFKKCLTKNKVTVI